LKLVDSPIASSYHPRKKLLGLTIVAMTGNRQLARSFVNRKDVADSVAFILKSDLNKAIYAFIQSNPVLPPMTTSEFADRLNSWCNQYVGSQITLKFYTGVDTVKVPIDLVWTFKMRDSRSVGRALVNLEKAIDLLSEYTIKKKYHNGIKRIHVVDKLDTII